MIQRLTVAAQTCAVPPHNTGGRIVTVNGSVANAVRVARCAALGGYVVRLDVRAAVLAARCAALGGYVVRLDVRAAVLAHVALGGFVRAAQFASIIARRSCHHYTYECLVLPGY